MGKPFFLRIRLLLLLLSLYGSSYAMLHFCCPTSLEDEEKHTLAEIEPLLDKSNKLELGNVSCQDMLQALFIIKTHLYLSYVFLLQINLDEEDYYYPLLKTVYLRWHLERDKKELKAILKSNSPSLPYLLLVIEDLMSVDSTIKTLCENNGKYDSEDLLLLTKVVFEIYAIWSSAIFMPRKKFSELSDPSVVGMSDKEYEAVYVWEQWYRNRNEKSWNWEIFSSKKEKIKLEANLNDVKAFVALSSRQIYALLDMLSSKPVSVKTINVNDVSLLEDKMETLMLELPSKPPKNKKRNLPFGRPPKPPKNKREDGRQSEQLKPTIPLWKSAEKKEAFVDTFFKDCESIKGIRKQLDRFVSWCKGEKRPLGPAGCLEETLKIVKKEYEPLGK